MGSEAAEAITVAEFKDTRGTRAGRKWAATVIERDGSQCVECGHTGSDDNPLQADHILPVSTHPELSLDLNNGQCLCKKCNTSKSDKVERKRKNWFDPSWLTSIN